MRKFVFLLQGIYYLLTGIWPVVHISSFMLITGPKTDLWLVKMVGLLAASVGITILVMRGAKTRFTILNYTTAISFLIIDVYYSMTGIISNIYMADAVLQLLFIVLLAFADRRKGQ